MRISLDFLLGLGEAGKKILLQYLDKTADYAYANYSLEVHDLRRLLAYADFIAKPYKLPSYKVDKLLSLIFSKRFDEAYSFAIEESKKVFLETADKRQLVEYLRMIDTQKMVDKFFSECK